MFNFKLLDSYTKEDKEIFFGRRKEIEALYQLTLKAKLLLLYGPTGVGKSSLLQCGLANRLENWEALFVRREDNINLALKRAISTAIKIEDENLEVTGNILEDLQTLHLCKMNTIYLVFDQFEELYISGSEDERLLFLQQIKELAKSRLNIKIILTIREEYIAFLADSEDEIPGLMDFRLRIEKMNTFRLMEVIQKTANAAKITLADKTIIPKILEILSIGKKEVELSYLQVYFYKLYNNAKNKNEIIFDSVLIESTGKAKDVLSEFLEEKLESFKKQNPEIPEELPMQLLNTLITDEATKKQMSEEELFKLFPSRTQIAAIGNILEFLEAGRILRILKEDKTKIELAHDVIARIVYEKLSAEQKHLRTISRMIETNFEMYKVGDSESLLTAKQLEIILPFEGKLYFEENNEVYRQYLLESKIQSKRKTWLLRAMVAVLIIFITGIAIYSWGKKKEADANEVKAIAITSESQFFSGRHLDSNLNALKAWKKSENLGKNFKIEKNMAFTSLLNAVYETNSNEITRIKLNKEAQSVSFSPDGNYFVTAHLDEYIILWDTKTKKQIHKFEGDLNIVSSVSFSSDGKKLISGSLDKSIKLWDVEKKELIHTFEGHTEQILSVSFSPDGKKLISGSVDKTVKLWDVETKKLIHTFVGHTNYILCVSFSPDGRKMISGSGDNTIKLWDVETKKLIHTFAEHIGSVNSVSFSPDGQKIISGSVDKTIKLWDVETKKLIHTFAEHIGSVNSVSFSSDGKKLISGSADKTIKLWDVETKKLIHTLEGHLGSVNSISFSPDDEALISGSSDNTIRLWELNEKKIFQVIESHTDSVPAVSFNPDGKTFISGSNDKTIKLWDLGTKKILHIFKSHTDSVNIVSFSLDGRKIISGSTDKTIKLWDVETKKLIHTLEGHTDSVKTLLFLPDGKRILSGSADNTIKLWNLEKRKVIHTFYGHINQVNSLSLSPDGNTFISASFDKTIKLWDVERKKLIHTFEDTGNVFSVSFSPDGKTFISASQDNSIKLWDLKTKRLLQKFESHTNSVSSVSFSPDGKTFISASIDNTIKLWDFETKRLLHTFKVNIVFHSNISFSPNGKLLLSGSEDNKIFLYNLELEMLQKSICEKLKDYLNTGFDIEEEDRNICTIHLKDIGSFVSKRNQEESNLLLNQAIFIASTNDNLNLIYPNIKLAMKKNPENLDTYLLQHIVSLYQKEENMANSFWYNAKEIEKDEKKLRLRRAEIIELINGLRVDSLRSLFISDLQENINVPSAKNQLYNYFINQAISQPANSKEYLEKAYSLNKNEAYYDYANNVLDSNLARKAIEKSLELNSDFKPSRKRYAEFLLEDSKRLNKEDPTIFELLEKAKKYDTENEDIYWYRFMYCLNNKVDENEDRKNFLNFSTNPEEGYTRVGIQYKGKLENIKRLKYFEMALTENPVYLPALRELAQFYLDSENYRDYIKVNETIISENPLGSSDVYIRLAMSYVLVGDIEKAQESIVFYIILTDNLEFDLNKQLLELAHTWTEAKKMEEAFLAYKLLGKNKFPLDSYIKNFIKYFRYRCKMTDSIDLGDCKKEFLKLTKSLKFKSKTQSYTVNANIYYDIEDFPNAILELTKLIDIEPLANNYFNRGIAYREAKEYTKSIMDLSKAIELDPKNESYYISRANTYSAIKDSAKAIIDYKKVLETNPNNHEALNNIAWELLISKNSSFGELEMALDYSIRSNFLSKDNENYLDTLVEIYLKLGDKYNASKFNNKAKIIAREKKNEEVLRGSIYRETKINQIK